MIEIRYKGILFLQALFLLLLGTFLYNYFKYSFGLHVPPAFWSMYLGIWIAFIILNLLFIKFFVLPSNSLIKKLRSSAPVDDMSWAIIEETLSQRDLDLKKQKEEFEQENLKYKTLLDSLHDPVCIFSKDEKILYSNPSFNTLFSLPEKKKLAHLIEVSRNHDFQNFVKKCLNSPEPLRLSDFTFNQMKDTYRSFYDIKIFPLKDIQNYLCLMHDVTERKMADQVREDFVANFSHEVRTPLTIMNGLIQNLRLSMGQKEDAEIAYGPVFQKIDNNSRRLINLFNDLLKLTSVEKKKDLEKEEVNVEQMIESLTEELALKYPAKKLTCSFHFKEPIFYVDYNLFEQVMINLIDNGLKYSKGEARLTISTYKEIQNNRPFSVLEIEDAGLGIPEDHVHRIFERFFRVDSSRCSETEGTGLGLSIVKHIIQKHEGKIRVQSKEHEGTKFILSFPLSPLAN